MNLDWLTTSPNRDEIQKLLTKRANLITDITMNGKYVHDYGRKLTRYTRQIERLYMQGLRRVEHG